MGAEHRPGQLQAQAAHGHLLRALPARVLQRLWKPQKPEAECCTHRVCLSGRHAAGEGERRPGRRGHKRGLSQGGGLRGGACRVWLGEEAGGCPGSAAPDGQRPCRAGRAAETAGNSGPCSAGQPQPCTDLRPQLRPFGLRCPKKETLPDSEGK